MFRKLGNECGKLVDLRTFENYVTRNFFFFFVLSLAEL